MPWILQLYLCKLAKSIKVNHFCWGVKDDFSVVFDVNLLTICNSAVKHSGLGQKLDFISMLAKLKRKKAINWLNGVYNG